MDVDVGKRFQTQRSALVRHAYRMLGEHAEAEDVLQDAYIRWHAAVAATTVADDAAFLRTTVTRLCLDRLRSARARRTDYVGPWLPEPLVTSSRDDPETIAIFADDVSFAVLLALERLTALERAAFLLHDVMDVPFAEVAATLGRSEGAVKQLASRARTHVRKPGSRRGAATAEASSVCEAFADAVRQGDLLALQRLLSAGIVLISDSGGKVPAAMVPVYGVDHVSRLIVGLARKTTERTRFGRVLINGAPGFVVSDGGTIIHTVALEIVAGLIEAIYVTRNPDKLRTVIIPNEST